MSNPWKGTVGHPGNAFVYIISSVSTVGMCLNCVIPSPAGVTWMRILLGVISSLTAVLGAFNIGIRKARFPRRPRYQVRMREREHAHHYIDAPAGFKTPAAAQSFIELTWTNMRKEGHDPATAPIVVEIVDLKDELKTRRKARQRG